MASHFISLLISVFLMSACVQPVPEQDAHIQASGRAVGQLKGLTTIERQIAGRIAVSEDVAAFSLLGASGPGLQGMAHALGGFDNSLERATVTGLQMNPFAALVWHQVIDDFAGYLASVICLADEKTLLLSSGTVRLHARFLERLAPLCLEDWNEVEARRAALKRAWHGFVGYGSEQERDAWVDYFVQPDNPYWSSNTRVPAMLVAMMWNPVFLLEN